ncbi:MAG: hypothetical protein K2X54_14410 [Methylobacterium organophilum]|jgi:hypothetical protein|nr:hypothetical protein [Methylobacterium organophilum]
MFTTVLARRRSAVVLPFPPPAASAGPGIAKPTLQARWSLNPLSGRPECLWRLGQARETASGQAPTGSAA